MRQVVHFARGSTITIKKMIEQSNIPAKLIRSTIKQFGGFDAFRESAPDVANHGISGGFHGFIYYADTVPFFRRNRKEIIKMSTEQAKEVTDRGGMLEMVAGFNCMTSLEVTPDEIARAIYTGKGECADQILNCLAWYAGEEVARLYCDLVNQEA